MSRLINPDEQFFDNDTGAPLALGTLYFGEPNQDPETNPKAVYSDAALTVAISPTQSLTADGKPAQFIYLKGEYSLTVRDAAGALIFNLDSVNQDINSLEQKIDQRIIYVGSVAELEGLSFSAGSSVYLTQDGLAGEFAFDASDLSAEVSADTEKAVYIAPSSDLTGASGAWVRREVYSLNVRWFGGSESNTTAQNRSALQAAIALAEFMGGGFVDVPYGVDYGLINNDATTQPDFSGLLNDVVVIDDSRADADGAARKAGAQRRIFCHTAQTSPEGQHNGNGLRVFGDWAPYYWVENNAQYAPQGDPSRTAADNRRASLFFANDGAATWRVGQGTQVGDLSDEQMSNFVIEAFNTSVGSGTYAVLVVQRSTGNMSFGGGTNIPSASFHFKSVTTGVANMLIESLTSVTTLNIRNSSGSGDDVSVRNNGGNLELFIPGVGSGLDVDGTNRAVRVNNLLGLPQKTKAQLSPAGTFEGYMAYVTDAAGGAAPAYSDGTNWISLLTGVAV